MRAATKMTLTQSSTVPLQDPIEFPGAAQPPPTAKARYSEFAEILNRFKISGFKISKNLKNHDNGG